MIEFVGGCNCWSIRSQKLIFLLFDSLYQVIKRMVKLISPNLIKDQDWNYIDIFLPWFLPSLDAKNNFQPVTLPPLTTGVTLKKANVLIENMFAPLPNQSSFLPTSSLKPPVQNPSTFLPVQTQKQSTTQPSVFDLLASIENEIKQPTSAFVRFTTRRPQTKPETQPNVEESIFNLLSFLQNNATTRSYLSTLTSQGVTRSTLSNDWFQYPTLRPFDELRTSPAKNFIGVILPNQNMTKIAFDKKVDYLAPRPVNKYGKGRQRKKNFFYYKISYQLL